MSADGTSSEPWFALANAALSLFMFVAGGVATVFYRGLGRAAADGESHGALMTRVATLEARVAEILVRKDRIDTTLAIVVTREELDVVAERIERHVGERITELMRVYEGRAGMWRDSLPREGR